jgi:hypothetical protein
LPCPIITAVNPFTMLVGEPHTARRKCDDRGTLAAYVV